PVDAHRGRPRGGRAPQRARPDGAVGPAHRRVSAPCPPSSGRAAVGTRKIPRAMEALTVSTTINRPREEVFAYLADIANHPEFTDHFLSDWRLTREASEGRGAGARYRQGGRF